MKKILAFLLVFIAAGFASTFCYQESANTSNQSGTDTCSNANYGGATAITNNWAGGAGTNTYDGNWGTYGATAIGGGYGIAYVNYTAPPGTIGANLIVKDGNGGTHNVSLTNYANPRIAMVSCKNADMSNADGYTWSGINVGACNAQSIASSYEWNGTTFVSLFTDFEMYRAVYEEGIWWENAEPPPALIDSFICSSTDGCDLANVAYTNNGSIRWSVIEEITQPSYLCYQESANTSNQSGTDGDCGLVYNGTYALTGVLDSNGDIDGNWASSARTTSGYGIRYVNYTPPVGVVSAKSTYKSFPSQNYTFIYDVLPNPLRLARVSCMDGDWTGADGYTWESPTCSGTKWKFYYLNGTNMIKYYEYASRNMYEEGIWWNISSATNSTKYAWYNTNRTATAFPPLHFPYQANVSFYAEGTGNSSIRYEVR